jgi:nitrous oxidase accessory protein NosD
MNRALAVVAATALVVVSSGPVSARPTGRDEIHVPGDYSSVQAAVDASGPGDTVVLGAGTFTGEVVIDHDLTLRGAGVGATTVKAPATLTSYGVHLPDGRVLTAIIRIVHGAHVRISDLTVSGPIPCGIEVSGIHALQGATLDLFDARVTDIQADPGTCPGDDAAGRAVVYGTPPHIEVDGERGSTAYGRVHDVLVDHFQHAGVSVSGPADGPRSVVTIDHSTVIGGWTIPTFQAGLWIDVDAQVDVHDNTVRGAVCGGEGCGPDPIFEGQGIGVLLLSLEPGSRVVDNDIDANDVGITQVVSPSCCLISHNTLRHNRWFGIVVQDGDGSTQANMITGGQVGIGVVADAVDTTARLRGDRISGTTDEAVREIDCCGYTATAVVTPRR